jgi:transposase
MEHMGVDLGSRDSQVCIRNEAGEIVKEGRCRTDQLARLLASRPPARVVLETCTEAFRIARNAQRHGHDVRVVAATLVHSLGIGQRGPKNDVRDARILSEASCRIELPSVHIPSAVSQEVKAICVSQEALVKARTQLVSRVRSYVRSRIGPLRATPDSLPNKVRQILSKDVEGLPAHVDRLLTALEMLSGQIADADAELQSLAREDERMQRLMTVPGVGPVTAARFVAAIDRVERFPNASSVASYLGLIPSEDTTGFRIKRKRLTRAAAPQVRWALGQAAWSLYLRRPSDPMVQWARRITERRGAQVAITALARKLVHILFAMWREKTTYDPRRSARLLQRSRAQRVRSRLRHQVVSDG